MMKINSIPPSDAVSKYVNNVGGSSAKNPPTANISDSLELSEGAQKFSALIKAAKEAMEKSGRDEEVKAASIMARMSEGSYEVSGDDVVKDILRGFPSKG